MDQWAAVCLHSSSRRSRRRRRCASRSSTSCPCGHVAVRRVNFFARQSLRIKYVAIRESHSVMLTLCGKVFCCDDNGALPLGNGWESPNVRTSGAHRDAERAIGRLFAHSSCGLKLKCTQLAQHGADRAWRVLSLGVDATERSVRCSSLTRCRQRKNKWLKAWYPN